MAGILNNNKNIDIEKIEADINRNIKKRKEEIKDYSKDIELPDSDNIYSLGRMRDDCDIDVARDITSHRPIVGHSLVKIRQLLDEEIRRSVDPVIKRQIEFNRKLIDFLYAGNQNRIEVLEKVVSELGVRLEKLEKQIQENDSQMNSNIREVFKIRRMIEKDGS